VRGKKVEMRRFLGMLITLLVLGSQALAEEILLKEEVVVRGGNIFLSDLASSLLDLSDLSLGVSPLPGRERTLSKNYIQARVKTLDDNLILVGPDRIKIRRESQPLEVEKVVGIAREAILKSFKGGENVRIELVRAPSDIHLPAGEVNYKVSGIRDRGRQSLCQVEIEVDGERIREVEAIFEVKRFGQVVVAKHKLNRDQLLAPDNLKIELREITTLKSPFTRIEDVTSLRASTFIREGDIITSKMVEIPPLIERGEIITILVEEGPVSITALGKSLGDGMKGEILRVRNLDSKREIAAKVFDEKTVVVE